MVVPKNRNILKEEILMKKIVALMMALMMALGCVAASAEMAGGWTIPEQTFPSDEAFDVFVNAMGEETDQLPQAVLGTQVVAGLNYAFLTRNTKGWDIVYLYHSVSGEDSLLREQNLVKTAEEGMAGGWNSLGEEGISVEELDKINTALFDNLKEIEVKEFIVMCTQVVAGTNYLVMTRVADESGEYWALVTVYADLENNVSVTDMQKVELSAQAE